MQVIIKGIGSHLQLTGKGLGEVALLVLDGDLVVGVPQAANGVPPPSPSNS